MTYENIRRPGARLRLAKHKMLKLTEIDTGEFIGNLRWGNRGVIYFERASHVKGQVVCDPMSRGEKPENS